MKKSVAIWYYKSKQDYQNDSRFYSFSPEVIDYINSSLYGGNPKYGYGEFAFHEVELNQMKSADEYYNVIDRVPIPMAIEYDTIKEPPTPTIQHSSRSITDLYGDLPERSRKDFPCEHCGLHFPSERQLRRHHRTCTSVSTCGRMMVEETADTENTEEKRIRVGRENHPVKTDIRIKKEMMIETKEQSDNVIEEPPSKRVNTMQPRRTGRANRRKQQQQQQQQQQQSIAEEIQQPKIDHQHTHCNQRMEEDEEEDRVINTLDGPILLSAEDVSWLIQ